MSLEFRIRGIVYELESRRPLPNIVIRAYDRDFLYDDLLGETETDKSGNFEIHYTEKDFKELFEKKPDVYFRLYDRASKRIIHSTGNSVEWNVGADEFFEIAVPRHKIPSKKKDVLLIDSQGKIRTEYEVGNSLLAQFQNLSPNQSYIIRILDDEKHEIFSMSLVANRYGVIDPTIIWPDIGFGDPEKGGRFAYKSYEEALDMMAKKTFGIEILHKGKIINAASFSIAESIEQPRLYPVSKSGYLKRGLLVGKDDLIVRGNNFQSGSLVHIYLVERQYDWHAGDLIIPIRDSKGSEIMSRVRIPEGENQFTTMLWPSNEIQVGSYDIIARTVMENEYRAEERLLWITDVVSERLITTLVVRDDVFRVKPIWLGCPNTKEMAGKLVSGPPYFKFTNNFPVGTDVWAALDPAGLMQQTIGKKVRFYVVKHKSDTEWSTDTSLSDVTGTISEIILTSTCINVNKTLVWSNPQQTGKYDIVADFGNNDPNPGNFIADDNFNMSTDIIDGYIKVGFYVTEDPSIQGKFSVGSTSYDEPAVTIPAVGVWGPGGTTYGDTSSGTLSLPLKAEIRYPADTNGQNVPVSPSEAPYPLVLVMHGMHTTADPSYLGYNYLLDHLASHGFIAVSIDCNAINAIGGFQDTRGHAVLEHLSLLQSMNTSPGLFQGKIDMTRIGIMGHSRGGEGVVQAEVYSQSLGLPFNIKAIVALAPTDFSGTSPNPLILSTAKFLCIYGSNDGDVWGGSNPSTQYCSTGFRIYDRATVEKAMVFIYGATHNRFNREWGTEYKVDTSSTKILSSGQHETLLKGYMTAFMQVHLQNRTEQLDYFNGELRIPQVDEVEVHCQYQSPTRLALDHFESNYQINQNTLGGAVSYSSLDGAPQENVTGLLDNHSPHQTRGILLRWNSTVAKYETEIPLPQSQRNVKPYKFLSFRVGQKVGSALNPLDQLQDFYVRLNTAGGGNSRAVKAGAFGSIPFPYKPEYKTTYDGNEEPNTKSAMKAIRIPLHAWTIKAMTAPIVDLGNVGSITFEFYSKPIGEILVDDVEFTL
ncbi:MAG: hypothetical protein ACFFCW_23815 [Candidatus Hodarchaeota archaeon]